MILTFDFLNMLQKPINKLSLASRKSDKCIGDF